MFKKAKTPFTDKDNEGGKENKSFKKPITNIIYFNRYVSKYNFREEFRALSNREQELVINYFFKGIKVGMEQIGPQRQQHIEQLEKLEKLELGEVGEELKCLI